MWNKFTNQFKKRLSTLEKKGGKNILTEEATWMTHVLRKDV